ncbi:hypothetical protein GF342_00675 [Candidatus Woesearchaeota archaeon]|nr:hypothetical protein [Candidatus Woesearchaeota archaeon]
MANRAEQKRKRRRKRQEKKKRSTAKKRNNSGNNGSATCCAKDHFRTFSDYFRFLHLGTRAEGLETIAKQLVFADDALRKGQSVTAKRLYRQARAQRFPCAIRDSLLHWSLMGELVAQQREGVLWEEERMFGWYRTTLDRELSRYDLHAEGYDEKALDRFVMELAKDADKYGLTWLSTTVLARAAQRKAPDPSAWYFMLENTLSWYGTGNYVLARKQFANILQFDQPEVCADILGEVMHEAWLLRYSCRALTQDRDDAMSASASESVTFLSKLFIALDAVYADASEQERAPYLHFRDEVLIPQLVAIGGRSELSVRCLNAVRPLAEHVHQLSRILEGRTRHKVFSLGDHVYKLGENRMIENEHFMNRYFMFVRRGVIDTKGMFDNGTGTLERTEGLTDLMNDPPRIEIGENILRLAHEWIPPHVAEFFQDEEVILCYGRLPGPHFRDFLLDDQSAGRIEEAYRHGLYQLANIHAFGPQHLLESVPFAVVHDGKYYQSSTMKKMDEGEGFTSADKDRVRDAFSSVARMLDNRKVTTYVKDANPLNWIVRDNDPRLMTAVDFESAQLAGPQYDLVKFLEHVQHLDQTTKSVLIAQYRGTYNDAVRRFNAQVPGRCHKQTIDDLKEFFLTYEAYVIDFVIKSVHDPNYAHPEFQSQKRDWMKRGVEATRQLMGQETVRIADKASLAVLATVFERYYRRFDEGNNV